MNPAKALNLLEKNSRHYSNEYDEQYKLELLECIGQGTLSNARQLHRFHEILCYLRAYPDSKFLWEMVCGYLNDFQSRKDLIRFRDDLVNSGINGTDIEFNFFSPMARWLCSRWPGNLEINWEETENIEYLDELLPLIVTPAEIEQLDHLVFDFKEWIQQLKGKNETDATFIKKRLDRISTNQLANDMLHDKLNLSFRLTPGKNTPSITLLYNPVNKVALQDHPFSKVRPNLRKFAREEKFTLRRLSSAKGKHMVDLAKSTMMTRERDLDGFSYGDHTDVCLASYADGLQVGIIGFEPGQRYLLHATYSFLVMKNGVPIGYGPINFFLGIGDLAFTTFSTYRGTEASQTLAKVMAIAYQLYQVNLFVLDPYQLGHDNDDGLQSGVWWFYYKLGFRPRDKEVKKLLKRELIRMKKDQKYRSSIDTLNQLSSENMYYEIVRNKSDNIIHEQLPYISHSISRYLAQYYGADREIGLRCAAQNAHKLLGRIQYNKLSSKKKMGWEKWGPIILQLKGINRWSSQQKRNLARLIDAKCGGYESDFNLLTLQHKKLQSGLIKLINSIL